MCSRAIRSTTFLTLALAGAVLMPSFLFAQQSSDQDIAIGVVAELATAEALPLFGPRVALEPFAPWMTALPETSPPQDRVNPGTNIAMMGAGGAGLVVGLLMGGDNGMIIATTGGVVGLVGLYRYLR